MNKAYRHVYKDGIGWVAIAENGSCVSSSKGSGTVSAKTKVEVLKNFFDLRNSVVLNNGFLLKGLFAATLFCGVVVSDLKAQNATPEEIAKIQNNGTVVYTDDQNFRVVESIENGEKIFTRVDENGKPVGEGGKKLLEFDGKYYDYEKILSMKQSDGSYLINDKYYIIPDGTLGQGGMKERPVFVERDFVYSKGGKAKGEKMARQDSDGKWYAYNLAGNKKLYYARFETPNGIQENLCKNSINNSFKDGYCYGFWEAGELQTEKVAGMDVLVVDADGYYVKRAKAITQGTTAEELRVYGKDLSTLNLPTGGRATPERLSLVGKDGKSVTPHKYTDDDQEVKDGKRKVGDNKDGTIRLGNVAKALQDDEAVNLGQLNETLKNLNTGTGKVPYVSIKSSITGDGSNYNNDGAKGKNAIAIGPNAKSGNNSVAIGFGAETGGSTIIDEASYDKIKKEIESVKNKYKRAEQLGNQEKMAEFGKRRDELEELLKTYDKRYEHNGKLITEADFDKLSAAEKEQATIKYMSNTMYENSVAIGHDAQALANDAVAIGNGAKVIVDGSKKIVAGGGVAIGQDSVSNAREDKDLKGYKPKAFSIDETSNAFENSKSAWIATNQPFAVGNDEKITRQITGVAAGTKDTDAVNVAQLKQVGFFIQGDIGGKGRIQNEDKYDNDTLNIKTDDNWKNDRTNIVYTGKNLETKSIAADGTNDPATKKPYTSKIKIAMTDTPRFKSITIADDDTMNNKDDNSPIELKKFDDNIGFAGENNSAIKLTNLAEGTIGEDSKDAITGGQLQKIIKGGLKFTANSGEHTAELGSTVSVKGAGTDWSNFDNGENIMTNIDGNNIVVGLSKELKNITSIENNGKKYTFGDTKLGDTSVITNKDLTEKGYVTADTQKTTSVSTDANSGIKVVDNTTGNNTDYKLSLDETKVKEIAGTTTLTADLAKKADKDAENLVDTDVTKWQEKLKINDKADKTEVKNLAKGSVEVVDDGKDIVKVAKTTANDKDTYTVSVDAAKLAGNTAFSDNFAKKDASNIADNKADWEKALGLGEYVKSVTGDKFINVNSDDKQNPKLSLDTEKLASDKTFVTNIAENNDFTTKLGDTFVTNTSLEAGYTKLDGSNLATIKKDKWRDALGVKDSDIKTLAQESVNVKAKDGSKVTVTDKTENGVKTFEVGVDLTGLNGTVYKFTAGDNLSVTDDGNGNVKYSLNKELKNITSIENNGKKYTFGDTKLGDTSVITNKDLTEKGYVTADTQKTTSVSTDANSGIKVVDNTTGNNTDYKLSLDETKVKEIAGTTTLTADLAKKADKNAENLGNDDVASWQTKLGIDNKADKTDLTNLAKTDLKNITNEGKTTIKNLAKGSVEVVDDGKDIVKVAKTTANDKDTYTVSVDAAKLAGNTAFSDNFAKKDASNIADNKADWEKALGLGEYVKSVTGDKFINVNSDDKQNPKLSLDTEKLASDKTFVTNIAENNDFTTKLGDTFVTNTSLEAGYTKLDGSNLATIKKDKWRDALGVKDSDIKTLAQESVNVKAKDGSKVTVTDKTENGVKTFEVGVDLTGLNGTVYKFTAGDNLSVTDDGNGNVKYSLNKELKNITSIENNGKKYTFGDTKLGDTSVITNKDLTEKGYVTADTQKTTSVSTDANSGIKVVDNTTGNNTDYKLSLDETKVKEIAGTTTLTADLAKKADKNAENLGNDDVASWQTKLGIDNKADKTEITNLTTKIDSGNFKSLSVSANGGTTYDIKANENIDFSGANGINVNYDATKNKFTFSADSSVIGGALSNKYAMLDGSNLKVAQGFQQGVWREALGLTNDNIANIFEGGKDISIKQNGNKYTIAYTGTGAGTGGVSETKVKEIIKKYIGGDIKNPDSKNKLITHNVSKKEITKNETIIAAINKINKEGIGFVHINGGDLAPDPTTGKSENDSSAEGKNAIAIGPKSEANGDNSIAIGVGNIVNGENSGAIGDPSTIDANNAYSLGNNNKIKIGADGSFAIGNNVVIEENAKSSLALGEKTKVSVAGGVALGSGSVANRTTNSKDYYIPDGATADQEKAIKETSKGSLGVVSVGETSADGKTVIASRQITGVAAGTQDSDAVNVAQLKAVQNVVNQGSKWIAVNTKKFDKNGKVVDNGAKAEAEGVNSVAIGAGSNTKDASNGKERDYTVSVGGLNKDGTVTQRTISNVAPGVLDSDAATMGQLRAGLNDVYGKLGEYKKDASAGTASALAVGNLPQATIPGKGMVSLGSGFYDGESAMAIGLSKMSDSGKWVFKGSASYDSQEKAGAALSVGFHF
ncbi:hypothetical protein CE91St25_01430 [Campylobacter ureolyticus]|uniref:YadA-like family protein n=1 Tax=Campylobacter ureolyticus TaxID=827 RepID=UPI001FC826FB|nr:YadA-like family protein [Campylobacter ureolyticus]GKH59807.1 hypothetical protein CE91St25_01430 [Campylobacter ureolyticus]